MQSTCLAAYGEKEQVAPFSYRLSPRGEEEILVRITHCGVCHSGLNSFKNLIFKTYIK